ncbi:MAG: hypothetical protein IKG21_03790 [Atopobiaceae bacterium]|nr:hypothetical protein [Atopobiaceae bacterium]
MVQETFSLGTPALVCRWRLYNGELPLQSRHMRALAARTVGGRRITPELVAWVKQRVEWGLSPTTCDHPDGVLMLVVDAKGSSALSLGPYQPLGNTSARELLTRAELSQQEARTTGVAPEELWIARHDYLVRCTSADFAPSGASSLIVDLAHTMGIAVQHSNSMLEDVAWNGYAGSEAFLVSDEHGIVPSSDHGGKRAEKFAQSYQKLLERNLQQPGRKRTG